MNDRAPIELQADTLVADIERQLAERRAALLAAAAAEAESTLQKGRDKARRQMRRAADEMRASARQRARELEAELENAQRREDSRRAREAIATAWPLLADALAARWADAAPRRLWIEALLAIAATRWPARRWTLRHPATLGGADLAALRALAGDATLVADPALVAGVVVEADCARLDGTPAALLADRARVEAALLAAIERCR